MEQLKKYIEGLIKTAALAHDSADALRFTQAALNAANALCTLKHIDKI